MPQDKYIPRSAYNSLNLKPIQELSTVLDRGVRTTKPRFILQCAQTVKNLSVWCVIMERGYS